MLHISTAGPLIDLTIFDISAAKTVEVLAFIAAACSFISLPCYYVFMLLLAFHIFFSWDLDRVVP